MIEKSGAAIMPMPLEVDAPASMVVPLLAVMPPMPPPVVEPPPVAEPLQEKDGPKQWFLVYPKKMQSLTQTRPLKVGFGCAWIKAGLWALREILVNPPINSTIF